MRPTGRRRGSRSARRAKSSATAPARPKRSAARCGPIPPTRSAPGPRLALAERRAVAALPPAYVARLFDDYAPRFDRHLARDAGLLRAGADCRGARRSRAGAAVSRGARSRLRLRARRARVARAGGSARRGRFVGGHGRSRRERPASTTNWPRRSRRVSRRAPAGRGRSRRRRRRAGLSRRSAIRSAPRRPRRWRPAGCSLSRSKAARRPLRWARRCASGTPTRMCGEAAGAAGLTVGGSSRPRREWRRGPRRRGGS